CTDRLVVVIDFQRAEVLGAEVIGADRIRLAAQTTLEAANQLGRHSWLLAVGLEDATHPTAPTLHRVGWVESSRPTGSAWRVIQRRIARRGQQKTSSGVVRGRGVRLTRSYLSRLAG